MKTKIIYFCLLLLLLGCKCFSQEKDWYLRTDFIQDIGGQMVYKQYGNVKFTFYTEVSLSERENIIRKTVSDIQDNLALLKESHLEDSIDIILVNNRNDMILFVHDSISGITYANTDEYIKQKTIICIGGQKNPLKHELMHMVSMCKWGVPEDYYCLLWLIEGLATYADPEAECDGYSFEEKYTYFMQNNKIIEPDSLIYNFDKQHSKISYNQSAYIVEYLIRNYGIAKLKQLWLNKMKYFALIYNISFKEIIERINTELEKKYSDKIDFDWDEFEKKCY